MNSPLPATVICFTYVYLVKVWGPKFMENRPAHKLQVTVAIYNIFQILANGYLCYELSVSGMLSSNGYNFFCQPVDYSNNEDSLRLLRAGYLFFILKLIDLVDTFFFVFRKKNNQITALHVVHHAILPISSWPGIRYVGGGHTLFFAFLSTFVHTIMYFYYFLSGLGPRFKKFLWWKRYLTILQLSQFVTVFVHSLLPIVIPNCDYPLAFSLWIACNESLMLFMFADFYKKAYTAKKKE